MWVIEVSIFLLMFAWVLGCIFWPVIVYSSMETIHESIENFNKFGKGFMKIVFWPVFAFIFFIALVQTMFTYEPTDDIRNTFRSLLMQNYKDK